MAYSIRRSIISSIIPLDGTVVNKPGVGKVYTHVYVHPMNNRVMVGKYLKNVLQKSIKMNTQIMIPFGETLSINLLIAKTRKFRCKSGRSSRFATRGNDTGERQI